MSIGEWVGQRSLLSEFERSHCIKDGVFSASNVIKSRFVISTEIPYDHIMYTVTIAGDQHYTASVDDFYCAETFLKPDASHMNKKSTAMQLKIFFCEGIINNKNTKPNPENTAVKVGHKITSNLSQG